MSKENSYSENTISIDESSPFPILIDNKNIEGIAIYPNENNYDAEPKINKINDLLLKIQNPESVKLFEVDYNSNLQQLPNLDRFQNIECFHIAGRKIKKYDCISMFNNLKSLFLVNYKLKAIPNLNAKSLLRFRAIRGKLEIIDFSCDYFEFQSCQNLKKFEKIRSKYIGLEGCHNVDLDSLSNVECLESLEIRGRKNLESLSFLIECTDIKDFVVTATDMRKIDPSVLNSTQNLKKCFFGQCSKKLLKDIAIKTPSIMFSNGDFAFKGDEQFDHAYYCNY